MSLSSWTDAEGVMDGKLGDGAMDIRMERYLIEQKQLAGAKIVFLFKLWVLVSWRVT